MRAVVVSLCFVLLVAASFASAVGHAASTERQVRVLSQGDCWQVACSPGDNAYEIEYLDGDMFVTVKAQFLDDQLAVVYATTHTLVEHSRMSTQRTFAPDKLAAGGKASAVRFECGSGRARITFGPAAAITKS